MTELVMTALAIFRFETGDSSCPFWTEARIIQYDSLSYSAISSALQNQINSVVCAGYDETYEELTDKALRSCGFIKEWHRFEGKEEINTYFLIAC